MVALKLVLLIIGAYFIGNISNARILSRFSHMDITKQGSGNPGTMNMIRSLGIKKGLLTLVLDSLKGIIPATIGFLIFKANGPQWQEIAIYSAGLAVVIGHMYPVCYKFKGGKSVACALGVFTVAQPLLLFATFACGVIYLLVFDYGAIFSFIVISVMTIVEAIKHKGQTVVILLLAVIYFIIMFAHRKNIIRLLIGKENKVNLKHSLKRSLRRKQKIAPPKETRKELKEKEIG